MTTAGSQHDDEGALEHLLLHDHPRAVRTATAFLVVALSLFVAMAIPPVRDRIDVFDQYVYDTTFPVKWTPLTALARTLDFLGSVWFLAPLRVAIAAFFTWRKRWWALATWILAILISDPMVGILKAAYDRPRPPQGLVIEATAAFPSGHSVAGAVVAVSLVVCFVEAGPARRNLEIAAGLFALVMGASRMYLGAHWFTDAVAGVAFGSAAAIAAAAIVQRFREHREATDAPVTDRDLHRSPPPFDP